MDTVILAMAWAALALGSAGTAISLLGSDPRSALGRSGAWLRILGFLAVAVASASIVGIEPAPLPDDTVPPVRPLFVVLGAPLGLALAILAGVEGHRAREGG